MRHAKSETEVRFFTAALVGAVKAFEHVSLFCVGNAGAVVGHTDADARPVFSA